MQHMRAATLVFGFFLSNQGTNKLHVIKMYMYWDQNMAIHICQVSRTAD